MKATSFSDEMLRFGSGCRIQGEAARFNGTLFAAFPTVSVRKEHP
jgi:hypothetical protein